MKCSKCNTEKTVKGIGYTDSQGEGKYAFWCQECWDKEVKEKTIFGMNLKLWEKITTQF